MSDSANVIEGVIVPLLTPVDENERVDEPALRAHIRRCLKGGVNGIFVGGSAGMGPLLIDDQWVRLMEIARDEVDDSVPLLGGVMATSTGRAIERIKILAQAGFNHVVVTPTYYITPTRHEEFMAHFDGCRQATDLNMIVYNIPSCVGAAIPVSAILEMVKQGWTRTIKESSGDRDYFTDVMHALKDTSAAVLQGNEPDIAWGLSSGARGLVPVCANYAPSLFTAAWKASRAGEEDRLNELQAQISSVRETLLMGAKHWLAGALYGVHTLGIGSGHVTRPIQKLTEAQQREIDALTEQLAIHEPI
jgi:4-hydroxy-tetrahydrodipicolinate synthase